MSHTVIQVIVNTESEFGLVTFYRLLKNIERRPGC
ncbi:hypothetical protein GEOBC_00254 [Geobacteraceae bacterium]|nr:hypothetical protein GEOBC_00254 [Geobacteraceae bacterium]